MAFGLPSLAILSQAAAEGDSRVDASGSIEGVVTYQADVRRRWRYARYYVQDPQKGLLAEAVVALRGKTLAGLGERQPQTVMMDQKNFQFVPETIAIRAGDAVKFTSGDPETHNVRTTGPLGSFSVNMPRGGEYVHTFARAGGIRRPQEITCAYHGAMRAWVFVFEHPHYQITGTDGRFRLDQVPPGEYQLEMLHPAGQLRWTADVRVAAGASTRIDIRVSPDYKVGAAR